MKRYYRSVFSAFFVNIAAGWFLTAFLVRELFLLLGNVIGVIICLYLALKLEKGLPNEYH